MKILRLTDPSDVTYPFDRELYDDLHVVYHGTRSSYSADIDSNGFVIGRPPFSVSKLKQIHALAEKLGLRTWAHTVVRGLARGNMLSRGANRAVFFSANYWFARDYATDLGGETVTNALKLTGELLAHLEGTDEGDSSITDVREFRDELRCLTTGSHPVVYAVRIEPEWLQSGSRLEREVIGDLVLLPVDLACERSVPAICLLGKAEYINGAHPGYCNPGPASWEEARRLGAT